MPRTPRNLEGFLRQRLQQLRSLKGWSREQAALELGVSPYYLMELETGAKDNPTLDFLQHMARVYDLEPFEVFCDEEFVRKRLKARERSKLKNTSP